MRQERPSQYSLYIATYDIAGMRVDTQQPKPVRKTGLVTHTHQVIGGMIEAKPALKLAVTQATALNSLTYRLVTPEGPEAFVLGLDSEFPQYLNDPVTRVRDKRLVQKYFEDEIRDPKNPVYNSLAEQYATHIRTAHSPNLLLQNANPLVSVLKAEELGHLDPLTAGQLNVVGVIHDVEGYRERLDYVKDRFEDTKMNLKVIAISEFVKRQLLEIGIPADRIFKVPNGFDVKGFDKKLEQVKETRLFDDVKQKNNLPDGDMIFVSARRVRHKRHPDIIDAIEILDQQGKMDGKFVAFSGASMVTTQDPEVEKEIETRIREKGLEDKIIMLDPLTNDEVTACYTKSFATILASNEPEGFGYSNIESMLAGVPVITTELGGPLDYIEDEVTGLFIQPNDPASIANALDKLFTNPELYKTIKEKGKTKAEEYTTENMTRGFIQALDAGKPNLSVNILPGRPFILIGEGMHSEVYRRPYVDGKDKHIYQIFKRDIDKLSLKKLQDEYAFLQHEYAAMPALIPPQTLLLQDDTVELRDTILIKRRIDADPLNGNLRTADVSQLKDHTIDQIKQFVGITKKLFRHTSDNPALTVLGSCVPDIIDPPLENLIIDTDGNLKLIDTNMLINTDNLNERTANAPLDIVKKKIYVLLLRRLMFFDAKFLGRKPEELKQDPFYTQYLDQRSIQTLMDQSAKVGEPIVTNQQK